MFILTSTQKDILVCKILIVPCVCITLPTASLFFLQSYLGQLLNSFDTGLSKDWFYTKSRISVCPTTFCAKYQTRQHVRLQSSVHRTSSVFTYFSTQSRTISLKDQTAVSLLQPACCPVEMFSKTETAVVDYRINRMNGTMSTQFWKAKT